MKAALHHLLHPFSEPVKNERYRKIAGDNLSVKDHLIKGIALTAMMGYLVFAALTLVPVPFIAAGGALLSLPVVFYVYHAAAKMFAWKNCLKHAPLLEAAEAGNSEEVLRILKSDNRIDVNYANYLGKTAVHLTAKNKNISLLQELFLEYDADLSLPAAKALEENETLTPLALLEEGEAIFNFLANRQCALKLGKILSERYDLEDINWENEYNRSPGKTAFILASHLNDQELWRLFAGYWRTPERLMNPSYSAWEKQMLKNIPLTIKKTLKIDIS